ncbi:MAG: uvrC [Cyanobacteria bacterium RYN_339]|nr:uvrC [Cyanobacteria bacterium RYN_339]
MLHPIDQQIRELPSTPGVYRFYDAMDRLLYIGKSVNLRTRVRSYFRRDGGHSYRTDRIKDEARRIEVTACGSELEALLVESQQIKRWLPPYNVLGRNYRHFPFIKIPNEPFARVEITYQLEDDGGTYFGPFPGINRVREALDAMHPQFRWRTCGQLPDRACFEQAIGRCSAPCVGAVGPAAYQEQLDALAAFLTGDGDRQILEMEQRMHAAAEALEFERARIMRDRIATLLPLIRRQGALQAALSELDCLVVLPAAKPGEHLWLVVRRGRLVHKEPDVTPRRRRGLLTRLAKVMAAPPPNLAVQQWELDEINIIAAWLHKNRTNEAAIGLANRPLAEAVDEALAYMAPGKAVAERVPERRIAGP